MKTYKNYLSGGSACKWYFNPDIPEAKELHDRYEIERIEIRRIAVASQQVIQPPPPAQQELKYLHNLQNIDPYEFPRNGCQCTVTIARLVPNVAWWFPSCTKCTKAWSPENNGYICYPCSNSNYRHKYKLLFIATDGTAEAEMICFGQIAQRIVGKPVDHVMRTFKRGEEFPPDVAGIVSQKYTFAITMTNQSYFTSNKSFMVNSIITSYGRQRSIPQVPGSSSSPLLNYHRSSGSSISTKNTSAYNQNLVTLPSTQQHTPPSSPTIVGTSDKEAPPLDLIDTPEVNTAKKRLTYDDPENEQDSDHEQHKKPKSDKMKAIAALTTPRVNQNKYYS